MSRLVSTRTMERKMERADMGARKLTQPWGVVKQHLTGSSENPDQSSGTLPGRGEEFI